MKYESKIEYDFLYLYCDMETVYDAVAYNKFYSDIKLKLTPKCNLNETFVRITFKSVDLLNFDLTKELDTGYYVINKRDDEKLITLCEKIDMIPAFIDMDFDSLERYIESYNVKYEFLRSNKFEWFNIYI